MTTTEAVEQMFQHERDMDAHLKFLEGLVRLTIQLLLLQAVVLIGSIAVLVHYAVR